MAGFSGFTDEEIRRFKTIGETVDCGDNVRQEPVKKSAINPAGKRTRPREKIRTRSRDSKPIKTKPAEPETMVVKQQAVVEAESKQEELVTEGKKVEEKPRQVEVVMEDEKVKELELSNIEKMQQKQKEMEMINKKKEKMLQTALKQRYAKTKKETETLKIVQKELSRLDNLLYTDVQVLRDKIDHACREFDAARKRYDRAETEFINAKVNLHDKTEVKDQLTEHLCSIIQQNEERKAKKLAELMTRLELGDQEINYESNENISEDLKESPSTSCTETNSNNKQIDENINTTTDTKSDGELHQESNPKELNEGCNIQNNNNENATQGQKAIDKTAAELGEAKQPSESVEKA